MADSPSPSKTGIVDIWDSALSVSSRVTALSVDFSASSSWVMLVQDDATVPERVRERCSGTRRAIDVLCWPPRTENTRMQGGSVGERQEGDDGYRWNYVHFWGHSLYTSSITLSVTVSGKRESKVTSLPTCYGPVPGDESGSFNRWLWPQKSLRVGIFLWTEWDRQHDGNQASTNHECRWWNATRITATT